MVTETHQAADDVREQSLERLKKKQDFRGHVLVYVLVMLLWTIWALTGTGFAWPAIVMGGWGIGVVMNAWDVFWRALISGAAIDREVQGMRRA